MNEAEKGACKRQLDSKRHNELTSTREGIKI